MEAREERQLRQLPQRARRQLHDAQDGQHVQPDGRDHARRRLIRVQDRDGAQDVRHQVHARPGVRRGAPRRQEGQVRDDSRGKQTGPEPDRQRQGSEVRPRVRRRHSHCGKSRHVLFKGHLNLNVFLSDVDRQWRHVRQDLQTPEVIHSFVNKL